MIKCFLVFFAFVSSDLHPNEQEVSLCSKVVVEPSRGFYCLSDGSIWKVMAVIPREKTISEWWYNLNIVPKNFECNIDDFYVGAKIKIIPRCECSTFNDEVAGNKKELASYSHVLMNTGINKCLFALPLLPETGLMEVYQHGCLFGSKNYNQRRYKEGYDNGCNAGYNKGYLQGYFYGYTSEGYQKGYSDGYTAGYNMGKKKD